MHKNLSKTLIIFFAAVSFSSCVKTFTCECTYKDSNFTYSTEENYVGTKKKAQSDCDNMKDDINYGYNSLGTGTVSCTLRAGLE
ncbi:MAG: hypothetical protein KDC07_06745 [Chitinophagaceae bacterium]|nr:hypothetical protein [Chitinophagaceae bacterium]MCB9045176.1 hypothetical protein [Chitinophagales bacterium]